MKLYTSTIATTIGKYFILRDLAGKTAKHKVSRIHDISGCDIDLEIQS